MPQLEGYYTIQADGRTFHAPGMSPWGARGVLLDMAVEALPDGTLMPRGHVVIVDVGNNNVLTQCVYANAKVVEAITGLMKAKVQAAMQHQRMREIAAAAGSKIIRMEKP